MSFARHLNYQFQRLVLQKQYLVAEDLPHDMKFRFRTPDDVGRHIFKNQTYEPHILQFLDEQSPLGKGGLALDVGANLGWYSVLLDRLSGGKARIHAFEPDPTNRGLLEQNLALNGVESVRVHEMALSDREGHANLNRYRAINWGKHTLLDLDGAVDSVSASLTTLDEFVHNQELEGREIEFVKIDVEGHEPSVINGAVRTLPSIRNLVLEYSPMYYERPAARQMLEMLANSGLRPFLFDGSRWERVDEGQILDSEIQVDTIWVRGPRAVR